MKRAPSRTVRIALAACVLAGTLLSVPQAARAQGIVYGQTIPAGTIVENDVLLFGDNVSIDGTVIGDVVAVGTTVRINGQVRGSLIVAAQTISINGSVGGTLYSAAADLLLGTSADIQRNLYYAGLSMTAQSGSRIERDLLGVTFGATLGGSIGRQARAVIGPLEIARLIIALARWDVKIPILTAPSGQSIAPSGLAMPGPHSLASSGRPALVSVTDHRARLLAAEPPTPLRGTALRDWLLGELRFLAMLIVMALLAGWLIPQFVADASGRGTSKPFASLGFGLIGLVLSFNLLGVALLIAVLILALGLVLGFVSLWNLSLLVWGAGLTALALGVLVMVVFVLFASRLIIARMAGAWMLGHWPDLALNRWLPTLVGSVAYVLVTSIPWIGWMLDLLLMAVGLGAAWLSYRASRAGSPPAIEVAPLPEAPDPVSGPALVTTGTRPARARSSRSRRSAAES